MILKIFSYYKNVFFSNLIFLLRNIFKFFLSKKISVKILFNFLFYSGFKNIYLKFKHRHIRENFNKFSKNKLKLSKDWFSHNIPVWHETFIQNFKKDDKVSILEIGSFEGLSSVYFLSFFKNSKIQCVETFEGSDEHSGYNFNDIKKRFSNNINLFKNRFDLYEGFSDSYFEKNKKLRKFDLIYVDGSHDYKDVLNDAINSFEVLNFGGIIIFDDFLRKFYKEIGQNPLKAILEFLCIYQKKIEIINVDYQLIIKKKYG